MTPKQKLCQIIEGETTLWNNSDNSDEKKIGDEWSEGEGK